MAKKKIIIEVDEEANDGLGELKVCSSDMEAEDLMAYLVMATSQTGLALNISEEKLYQLLSTVPRILQLFGQKTNSPYN